MPNDAFTAGVRPGGLNSSTEIRVLLCYLMHSVPTPLTQTEIEQALLSEELVNYFEMAGALSALCAQGLASESDGHYTLLKKGHDVAATLADSLPLSVREKAVRAAIMAQQFARKEAQHRCTITPEGNGYSVHCSIEDMGSEIFSCSMYLPDPQSATLAKKRFVEDGDDIFKVMLASLTGNRDLISEILSEIFATS